MDPKELFLEPLKSSGEKIISLLPTLVGALVILLLGWLLAKILKAALIKLLVAVRFEKFGERYGLSKFLSRGDIKHSLADILGTLFFWIIFLFFIYIAADVLKLSLIKDLINRIISFIPNLIAAVLIIIIGVFLSSFFKGVVKVTASSYDLAHRELLGKIVQYLIIFFTLAIALEQLGVATQILVNSVLIIIGAIAFGLALAFGLGSKDVAGKIVNKILESEKTAGASSNEVPDPSEKVNLNHKSDQNNDDT
jgi:small-conductance mechanosensitive channel